VSRSGFHLYQETTGGHVCISDDGSAAWVCPMGFVATGSLPHCRLELHGGRATTKVSNPCTMHTYLTNSEETAKKRASTRIILSNWHREWEVRRIAKE
jgi:hypothetical protein